MHRFLLVLLMSLAAVPAQAQLCDGSSTRIGADGRALGHLPYGDAAPGELARMPDEWTIGPCQLRREVIVDLQRLLTAAATDPLVAGRILALSCHRSIAYQQAVFCRGSATEAAGDRAISVAPPGHSEHATGFALDFAFRPRSNGCPDAEACIAATPAFRWLVANAPRYGFEMSFPAGNRQGVKWEPWHWRWVGTGPTAVGAARARALFARARRDFPAEPAVDPIIAVRVIANAPAPPVYLPPVMPPECRRGKCRIRKAGPR